MAANIAELTCFLKDVNIIISRLQSSGEGPALQRQRVKMATAALVASFDIALSVAERTELEKISSDLRFLLNEYEVPEKWQLLLLARGYSTLTTFGVVADDRPGLRLALAQDFDLNGAEANLSDAQKSTVRNTTTRILAAWLAASQRVSDEVRQTSDQRLLRLPTTVSRTHLIAMRQKFEAEHGRISDSVWPCPSLIERRLDEVEEGSFSADLLTEVVSVEKANDEQVVIHDIGVNVRVRKHCKNINQPTTTEELRNRMKTLAITFVLASYRHSSRLWLRTATLPVFLRYTEYLLSDQCALFHMDEQGLSIQATWETVLGYDLAMRKAICRSVLYQGMDFEAAMVIAMDDLTCRTRYFITPTALLSSRSSSSTGRVAVMPGVVKPPDAPAVMSNKQKRQAERITMLKELKAAKFAKGKGKGKEKGKATSNAALKTPDGRLICRFFNEASGCSRSGCSYVHCCSKCYLATHGATDVGACKPSA